MNKSEPSLLQNTQIFHLLKQKTGKIHRLRHTKLNNIFKETDANLLNKLRNDPSSGLFTFFKPIKNSIFR